MKKLFCLVELCMEIFLIVRCAFLVLYPFCNQIIIKNTRKLESSHGRSSSLALPCVSCSPCSNRQQNLSPFDVEAVFSRLLGPAPCTCVCLLSLAEKRLCSGSPLAHGSGVLAICEAAAWNKESVTVAARVLPSILLLLRGVEVR